VREKERQTERGKGTVRAKGWKTERGKGNSEGKGGGKWNKEGEH
jgi:hypothetical protein